MDTKFTYDPLVEPTSGDDLSEPPDIVIDEVLSGIQTLEGGPPHIYLGTRVFTTGLPEVRATTQPSPPRPARRGLGPNATWMALGFGLVQMSRRALASEEVCAGSTSGAPGGTPGRGTPSRSGASQGSRTPTPLSRGAKSTGGTPGPVSAASSLRSSATRSSLRAASRAAAQEPARSDPWPFDAKLLDLAAAMEGCLEEVEEAWRAEAAAATPPAAAPTCPRPGAGAEAAASALSSRGITPSPPRADDATEGPRTGAGAGPPTGGPVARPPPMPAPPAAATPAPARPASPTTALPPAPAPAARPRDAGPSGTAQAGARTPSRPPGTEGTGAAARARPPHASTGLGPGEASRAEAAGAASATASSAAAAPLPQFHPSNFTADRVNLSRRKTVSQSPFLEADRRKSVDGSERGGLGQASPAAAGAPHLPEGPSPVDRSKTAKSLQFGASTAEAAVTAAGIPSGPEPRRMPASDAATSAAPADAPTPEPAPHTTGKQGSPTTPFDDDDLADDSNGSVLELWGTEPGRQPMPGASPPHRSPQQVAGPDAGRPSDERHAEASQASLERILAARSSPGSPLSPLSDAGSGTRLREPRAPAGSPQRIPGSPGPAAAGPGPGGTPGSRGGSTRPPPQPPASPPSAAQGPGVHFFASRQAAAALEDPQPPTPPRVGSGTRNPNGSNAYGGSAAEYRYQRGTRKEVEEDEDEDQDEEEEEEEEDEEEEEEEGDGDEGDEGESEGEEVRDSQLGAMDQRAIRFMRDLGVGPSSSMPAAGRGAGVPGSPRGGGPRAGPTGAAGGEAGWASTMDAMTAMLQERRRSLEVAAARERRGGGASEGGQSSGGGPRNPASPPEQLAGRPGADWEEVMDATSAFLRDRGARAAEDSLSHSPPARPSPGGSPAAKAVPGSSGPSPRASVSGSNASGRGGGRAKGGSGPSPDQMLFEQIRIQDMHSRRVVSIEFVPSDTTSSDDDE